MQFGPKFTVRFLGQTLTGQTSPGDVCAGNICPDNIYPDFGTKQTF